MRNLKKILITGATGCLGQNATEQLLSNKVVSVRATGRDSRIGASLAAQGAEFVAMDLRNASYRDLASLVKGCDAVWYCAGTHPSAEVEAQEHILVNSNAAIELFKACREANSVRRFIYVSTSRLYYDGAPHHEVKESYLAGGGGDEFIRSKAMAETYFRVAGASSVSIRTTIIRPSDFYGPYERHWLPPIVDEVRRERSLLLPRGGGALRDFV